MPFGAGEIDEPEPRAGAARSVGSDRERNRAGTRLGRGDRGRASCSAGFRMAIFVEGSRPAILAVRIEPPGATSSNSSLRGSACSEVTTIPDGHSIPVTCRSRARRMATTAFSRLPRAQPARSKIGLTDRFDRTSGNSYRLKIGTNLGDSSGPDYRPDGRVGPGHLTG